MGRLRFSGLLAALLLLQVASPGETAPVSEAELVLSRLNTLHLSHGIQWNARKLIELQLQFERRRIIIREIIRAQELQEKLIIAALVIDLLFICALLQFFKSPQKSAEKVDV